MSDEPDGPEIERVRALLESRMLGLPQVATRIGRFVVLRKLGAGGMGVVYAAYDEEIDRKVAVKLLRSDVGGHGSEGRLRLVREAQALGKVAHPNVVAVHDVGEHQQQVFIAMEFVEGRTLRAWWTEAKPHWREILQRAIEAARGLAAAHRVGLVHRDFKPENVIVGDDGRVRVLDFGLARVDDDATGESLDDASSDSRELIATPLTGTGQIVGTPAYMSPEQFARQKADARSDQFSLCVVLWEGLFGERPFAGTTFATLAAAVQTGELRPVPRGRGVPSWLVRIMARGLAVDPQRRWPSIEALLDALGRGDARARTKLGVAGVGVAVVGAASVWGFQRWDDARRSSECRAQGQRVAEVWNDDARTSVDDAFAATGVSYAASTLERALPRLDDYAARWSTTREQSCLAASVEHTRSSELQTRTTDCLEEHREELNALVGALTTADAQLVQRAIGAIRKLPKPEACVDDAALLRRPATPDDPETGARVADLRLRLAAKNGEFAAGRYARALESADALLAEAESSGPPALHAAALLAVGRWAHGAGEYARATGLLERGVDVALRADDDELATDAMIQLVTNTRAEGKYDRTKWWSDLASALVARLGDGEDLRAASLLDNMGEAEREQGRYDEARALHVHALAIGERVLGAENPELARTINHLANVEYATGRYDEARVLHERALAIFEVDLGPDHPNVAMAVDNLALDHSALGDYAEARRLHERSLAILEKALGPDHPDVAWTLNSLGGTYFHAGDLVSAKAMYERALAIKEKTRGPDHPDTGAGVHNLGNVYGELGDAERARAMYERALAIFEKSLGPDHPEVASSLHNLANSEHARGEYETAKALHRRALAIREKALGPDHADVAHSLYNLANVHFALGEFAEARPLYERALAIFEKALGPDHESVAMTLTGFAMLLNATGDHVRAQEMHERALAIYEKALGRDHPKTSFTLLGLGNVALARKRPAEAIPFFERALAIREANHGTAIELAETRYPLARALWETGEDRTRALELAREAVDGYRAAGPLAKQPLADAERWLKTHRRP